MITTIDSFNNKCKMIIILNDELIPNHEKKILSKLFL